jgi:Spy/CpxP family protein refolding chaperone
MTDSTQTPVPPPEAKRRWRWTRRVLFGSGLALLVASGGAYFAKAQGSFHGHHRGGFFGHGAGMDVDSAQDFARFMTRRLLGEIEATPEQRSRVVAIVEAAVKDLHPLRDQTRASHEQSVKLMTAATIDRAAAERLRAQQIALHEQGSKRLVQALLDIAEQLTPEQREKLAKHLAEHRWRRHH